jgi:hypothetical protein
MLCFSEGQASVPSEKADSAAPVPLWPRPNAQTMAAFSKPVTSSPPQLGLQRVMQHVVAGQVDEGRWLPLREAMLGVLEAGPALPEGPDKGRAGRCVGAREPLFAMVVGARWPAFAHLPLDGNKIALAANAMMDVFARLKPDIFVFFREVLKNAAKATPWDEMYSAVFEGIVTGYSQRAHAEQAYALDVFKLHKSYMSATPSFEVQAISLLGALNVQSPALSAPSSPSISLFSKDPIPIRLSRLNCWAGMPAPLWPALAERYWEVVTEPKTIVHIIRLMEDKADVYALWQNHARQRREMDLALKWAPPGQASQIFDLITLCLTDEFF